jgi:hypothetical protein
MKGFIRLFGLFVLLAAIPAAHAADATGTWKGSVDVNGAALPLVLHLTVASGAVTGSIEGMPTTPAPIHDGKADADGITFSANSDYQGQAYKLMFHGKLAPAGDEIAFTVGTDDGSWSGQMTVERASDAAPAVPAVASATVPAVMDVNGTWKGGFDVNGTTMSQTIHLTSANGVVTGTVEGLTTPAEIHEGKIDGDTVTFWISTDYQGTTYKVVYKGKVAAGQIVFTLGTDDGSWSTQMTAAKG